MRPGARRRHFGADSLTPLRDNGNLAPAAGDSLPAPVPLLRERANPDFEEEAFMVSYAVRLVTRYDGLVIATFPDLPGVTALGRDDEEARDEARRALEAELAAYEAKGIAPPEPSTRNGAMISAPLVARPLPA